MGIAQELQTEGPAEHGAQPEAVEQERTHDRKPDGAKADPCKLAGDDLHCLAEGRIVFAETVDGGADQAR